MNVAALCLVGAAAFTFQAAHADVTIKEQVVVEGTGIMSLASMSGTTTTSISGTSARIEGDMRMNSGLARFVARGAGQTTEIVRLADDVVLELDTRKKRYRQSTLSARRALLEQASQQLRQAQAQNPVARGFDESQCEWSDPTTEVRKPGAKATIAGMIAEQVTLVVKQTCRDRKSGALCEVGMSVDEWMTPDLVGVREAQQFRVAYAQQLGASGAAGHQAESLFGRYPASWAKVAEELKKLEGFPIKTGFALEMGGAGCQGPSGQQGARTPLPGEVAGEIARLFRGRNQPAAQVGGGSSAPAASVNGSTAGSNALTLLRVSSELIAIDSTKLGSGTFEAPVGFKRIDE